eukprot:Hpha_TRINITY_DN33594_c0_g1::TRINITY_DN33594_c0_g1_i1::g.171143::m.171143
MSPSVTRLDENEFRSAEQATLSVAIGAQILESSAPGASTLALFAEAMCMEFQERLSAPLDPFGNLFVGLSPKGSPLAGAILGNLILVVAHVSLVRGFRFVVGLLKWGRTREEIDALIRYPGGLYVPPQHLLQGTSYSAAQLLQNGNHWILTIAGLAGYPLRAYWMVLRHGMSRADFVDDPKRGAVLRWLLGRGEWVNSDKTTWYSRCGSLLKPYRPKHAKNFCILQFTVILLTSVLKATSVRGWLTCWLPEALLALLYGIQGLLFLYKMPFARPRDNFYGICTAALIVFASLAKALAYAKTSERRDHIGFAVSAHTLALATILLAVKILFDITSELYVVCTKRRAFLQQLKWQRVIAMGPGGHITDADLIDDEIPERELTTGGVARTVTFDDTVGRAMTMGRADSPLLHARSSHDMSSSARRRLRRTSALCTSPVPFDGDGSVSSLVGDKKSPLTQGRNRVRRRDL